MTALLLRLRGPVPADAPETFALALRSLDGVGRVTARRLAEHFDGPSDLRDHSREQVLLRIKGVANAEQIVRRLFESNALPEALAETEERVQALDERGVTLIGPRSVDWPRGLGALPPAERPLLLWAHGHAEALPRRPSAAFLARPPLAEAPFERAQALAGHLLARGGMPVVGAQSGFDVALAKRAAGQNAPAAMVAACGLGQVPREVRPVASQVVRAGGLLLSPFPMQHGPFEHDERERAQVQAAVARAAVFAPPEASTPEAHALGWATDAGPPAFVLGDEAPGNAQLVRGEDDFDAVLDAATREDGT